MREWHKCFSTEKIIPESLNALWDFGGLEYFLKGDLMFEIKSPEISDLNRANSYLKYLLSGIY